MKCSRYFIPTPLILYKIIGQNDYPHQPIHLCCANILLSGNVIVLGASDFDRKLSSATVGATNKWIFVQIIW